ncbi:MAG: restriction endonuclease subunit S, partial [Gammaproteobacteria bacterium]
MIEKKPLPTGWKWVAIIDVCEFKNGLWVGKKPPFEKASVIRSTNFGKYGKIIYDNIAQIEVEKHALEEKPLQAGDIIIENSGGGPKQPVGRVVFFDGKEKGIYSFG